MPLPRPENVRYDSVRAFLLFDVHIEGRSREAAISMEAIGGLYAANDDPIRAVKTSSLMSRFVVKLLDEGAPEPVRIESHMLKERGLLHPNAFARNLLVEALGDAMRVFDARQLDSDGVDYFHEAREHLLHNAPLDQKFRDLIISGYAEMRHDDETEQVRRELRELVFMLFRYHL